MKKTYICPNIIMAVANVSTNILDASNPSTHNEMGNGSQLSKGTNIWDNMQTDDEE